MAVNCNCRRRLGISSVPLGPHFHLRACVCVWGWCVVFSLRTRVTPKQPPLQLHWHCAERHWPLASALRPYAGPSGPGQRSPGPPRPPAGLATKDVDRREKQRTTERLSYVLVGSNRQTKSPVGLQKGNKLPKTGSVSFSMSDSR